MSNICISVVVSLFVMFLILGECYGCVSSGDLKIVNEMLTEIDESNSNSLYGAQRLLMVPVTAAFKLGIKELQNDIINRMLISTRKTIKISILNQIDTSLTIKKHRKCATRKVFPTIKKDEISMEFKPGNFEENRIATLQYAFLLSYVVKLACFKDGVNEISKNQETKIREIVDFLEENIIVPYWLCIPAWNWSYSFSNMKNRCLAKISASSFGVDWGKSYFSAILDEDLFLFSIAANVLTYYKAVNRKSDILDILLDIQEMAYRVLQQRLENGNNFIFQKGYWRDHKDYKYSNYKGVGMPDREYEKSDVSEDVSHSDRWPWWIFSLRDCWENNHIRYLYYQSLLDRLASQFSEKIVLVFNNCFVLTKNYMDGTNGWYRVKYKNRNWGYGPYALSRSALSGSWFVLGAVSKQIRHVNKVYYNMVVNMACGENDLWVRYYGAGYSINGGGLKDVSQKVMERYRLVVRFSKMLGWIEDFD